VRTHERVGARLGALQVALADRRPVVGLVELAPDEEHGALEALRAQRRRRRRPGDAATDEEDVDGPVGHARA
jgi:hypothetical protein